MNVLNEHFLASLPKEITTKNAITNHSWFAESEREDKQFTKSDKAFDYEVTAAIQVSFIIPGGDIHSEKKEKISSLTDILDFYGKMPFVH